MYGHPSYSPAAQLLCSYIQANVQDPIVIGHLLNLRRYVQRECKANLEAAPRLLVLFTLKTYTDEEKQRDGPFALDVEAQISFVGMMPDVMKDATLTCPVPLVPQVVAPCGAR
jgi:hypothetical protein